MRLEKPRKDHAETADGSASLRFEGVVPGRDGGSLYRFQIEASHENTSGLVANALVRSETTFAAARQADNEGLDLDALSLKEQSEYLQSYAEKFGRSFSVKEFRIENNQSCDIEIEPLVNEFIELFFILNSSFSLNNKEEGKGYYPDEIIFEPYELRQEYHRKFFAGGG